MKLKIYIQDNCDFCKEISIPEGIAVEQIYINRDGFDEFRPPQVPVMQVAGINLEGPYVINDFLKIVQNAKEGKYDK